MYFTLYQAGKSILPSLHLILLRLITTVLWIIDVNLLTLVRVTLTLSPIPMHSNPADRKFEWIAITTASLAELGPHSDSAFSKTESNVGDSLSAIFQLPWLIDPVFTGVLYDLYLTGHMKGHELVNKFYECSIQFFERDVTDARFLFVHKVLR